MKIKKVKNLASLREQSWKSFSVKEEMRVNLIDKIKNGETLIPDIIGYEKTVFKQLIHALFSKHDVILLGLRGQGKTKIIRSLKNLLDEYVPIIEGSPLNEDPYFPILPKSVEMVKKYQGDTPIEWIHRDERYQEKLATPDVSISDLIGDIDPIKAAREKLDISNEEIIHWGLIPRTNRGIFAINELPDLQPRIQVGLFNILEENDLQIRGFPIRIKIDMFLAFSANPEDYTNRGSIVTPLKDRIGSQIMTHYPKTIGVSRKITESQIEEGQEAFEIPEVMKNIVEQVGFCARESEYVDHHSGVSARMTICAYQNLRSSVERRALISKDKPKAKARLMDLYAMVSSITGRVELIHEGDKEGQEKIATLLISEGIYREFIRIFPKIPKNKFDKKDSNHLKDPYSFIKDFFASGKEIILKEEMSQSTYETALKKIDGLSSFIKEQLLSKDKTAEDFIYMEMVLEALHYTQMISREVSESSVIFLDSYSKMMRGFT